ncbi:hypothetical protein A2U01_0028990, partial [Trifolium medium]|nr:hypothetical protein [Trifolium medium]
MVNHDVSRILVDEGSSYDIIYEELFTKLGLKKENLAPYHNTYLQGFIGAITRPWGFVDLLVTFGEGEIVNSERTVDVQFFVDPCKSVYNCILGRPTLASLRVLLPIVHLKIKYHNAKDEVVTCRFDGSVVTARAPLLGDPVPATSRSSVLPSLVEFLPSVGIEPRTLGFKYVFNAFPLERGVEKIVRWQGRDRLREGPELLQVCRCYKTLQKALD